MIENIKRFINEHHTLMVVIIGLLVIYFLYWWFCCKDGQLVNKVKGGEVSLRLIGKKVGRKTLHYNCIGMCIKYLKKGGV